MRGFAMRLFHMGRDVAVWGDMTTPALGAGDLFIASAGPGDLPTAQTLVEIARKAGARTALVTAQPAGGLAKQVDIVTIHSRPDDGERSGRQTFRPADGLAVRDRADDRLRTRRPETAPALQRNVGDDARAAHQSRVIASSEFRQRQARRIDCDHNLSQLQPQFLSKPSGSTTTRIRAMAIRALDLMGKLSSRFVHEILPVALASVIGTLLVNHYGRQPPSPSDRHSGAPSASEDAMAQSLREEHELIASFMKRTQERESDDRAFGERRRRRSRRLPRSPFARGSAIARATTGGARKRSRGSRQKPRPGKSSRRPRRLRRSRTLLRLRRRPAAAGLPAAPGSA